MLNSGPPVGSSAQAQAQAPVASSTESLRVEQRSLLTKILGCLGCILPRWNNHARGLINDNATQGGMRASNFDINLQQELVARGGVIGLIRYEEQCNNASKPPTTSMVNRQSGQQAGNNPDDTSVFSGASTVKVSNIDHACRSSEQGQKLEGKAIDRPDDTSVFSGASTVKVSNIDHAGRSSEQGQKLERKTIDSADDASVYSGNSVATDAAVAPEE